SQPPGRSLATEIGGGTPRSGYYPLDVHGGVSLAGGLNVSLINGFVPAHGQLFTVVNNDGSDAIVGTFLQGSSVTTADGYEFQISSGAPGNNDVTLTYVNHRPVATDDSYSVPEDGILIVNAAAGALSNDADADHDALSALRLSGPVHGSVMLNANGSFTYTPGVACGAASDSSTYMVSDNHGGTATAT